MMLSKKATYDDKFVDPAEIMLPLGGGGEQFRAQFVLEYHQVVLEALKGDHHSDDFTRTKSHDAMTSSNKDADNDLDTKSLTDVFNFRFLDFLHGEDGESPDTSEGQNSPYAPELFDFNALEWVYDYEPIAKSSANNHQPAFVAERLLHRHPSIVESSSALPDLACTTKPLLQLPYPQSQVYGSPDTSFLEAQMFGSHVSYSLPGALSNSYTSLYKVDQDLLPQAQQTPAPLAYQQTQPLMIRYPSLHNYQSNPSDQTHQLQSRFLHSQTQLATNSSPMLLNFQQNPLSQGQQCHPQLPTWRTPAMANPSPNLPNAPRNPLDFPPQPLEVPNFYTPMKKNRDLVKWVQLDRINLPIPRNIEEARGTFLSRPKRVLNSYQNFVASENARRTKQNVDKKKQRAKKRAANAVASSSTSLSLASASSFVIDLTGDVSEGAEESQECTVGSQGPSTCNTNSKGVYEEYEESEESEESDDDQPKRRRLTIPGE